jgi:hypothetical protein
VKHGLARRPAPNARRPRLGQQAAWPILRVVGTISGAGGAPGASAAGRGDIAIGLLALAAFALVGHQVTAMLRDQRFGKIASDQKTDRGILRELNIHEAIRSGQLSSEDAAIVLSWDLPVDQLQQSQHSQGQSPGDPGIEPQRQ